eukprot:CAMPEP_0115148920 /NCGR_PEP_ID=MMETSP0227-20121206/64156_1 /TAXON_ID=89957 /ORGANISM="Polarella glacialis, Strain CCMP 1383" /LENGTH=546 /DNA_ID=CAMNT_0002559037 /DNA_START=66 /DNA_END=1707 /DNA_ORIENTATION=-
MEDEGATSASSGESDSRVQSTRYMHTEPVRVRFARYMHTEPGDSVILCGSPKWLGSWDLALGLPCSCQSDGTGLLWEAVALAPNNSKNNSQNKNNNNNNNKVREIILETGGGDDGTQQQQEQQEEEHQQQQSPFEYKYVRVLASGGCVWEDGPNRTASLSGHCKQEEVTIDDRLVPVRFKMHYETPPGTRMVVCGAPTALGAWDLSGALQLECTEHGFCEAIGSLPSHHLEEPFSCKFAVVPESDPGQARWESGEERIVHLGMLEEPVEGIRELWSSWEGTLVKFSIYYPTNPGEVMAVCGGHDQLGSWKTPRPMSLGREQMLRTNVMGVSWEVTFPIHALGSQGEVEYRYAVLPSRSWRGRVGARAQSQNSFSKQTGGGANATLHVRDVNFVGGMQFDFVPPCLFVGPYPQTPEHIDRLKDAGVGGVLNTQTQEDFHRRGIDGKVLWDAYYLKQIDARHFPIEDFNGDDLARKLLAGAAEVDDMVRQGKKVFIHCTAGMGRAPAVAVVYLCRYQGYSFEHAHSHVRAHRKVATPNVGAMRRALGI